MSEPLLRETLRMDYAELRDALSDFLASPASLTNWKLSGTLERAPAVKIREATVEEIGALRCEWERLEVKYVSWGI